jgi:ATP-binding cassette, subfamily B, bacterial
MSTSSVPFAVSLRLLVATVCRTAPRRTGALVGLATVAGLAAPAVLAASGLAVTRAPDAVGRGLGSPAGQALLMALVLVGVLFAVEQMLAPVRNALGSSIGSAVVQRLREQLLAATLSPPGIGHLEDPVVAGEIARGREIEWDVGPMTRIVEEMAAVVTRFVGSLGAAILLLRLAWWVPVVLLAAIALSHVFMRKDDWREIEKRDEHMVLQRRADYRCELALDPPAAKETRLFGLVDHLVETTRRYRLEFLGQLWRSRRARRRPALATVTVIVVANGVVLGHLAAEVLAGQVSPGALTVYVPAVAVVGMLGHGALDLWWVYQGAAAIPHISRLPDLTRSPRAQLTGGRMRLRDRGDRPDVEMRNRSDVGSLPASGTPRREVRLRGVRFGYPGAGRPVLSGLDLTIPAGSSLALVGANGAGKTTLLKLLVRLYDPDEGVVEVDGVDLRAYDLGTWRRQVAAVFADFVRYELSAAHNVAFGRIDDTAGSGIDVSGRPAELRRAARLAGALDLVEDLPSGWQTVLARQYRGGTDLSGGQWQRVALARALRAAVGGARLLVLDEPTANLDIRAEAELFDHVLAGFSRPGRSDASEASEVSDSSDGTDLAAGASGAAGATVGLAPDTTTLLITHRLSTVRHADRICVLGGGRVVEDGTHADLVEAGGAYARMFRLQADRFLQPTSTEPTRGN